MENDLSLMPLKSKIALAFEKHGTHLISKVLVKDKYAETVSSFYDIPYSSDKNDTSRMFDWHCPRIIADCIGGAPTPVLFYIHGGSWTAADKSIFTILAKDFAERGIIVINVNYRLMPENSFTDTYADAVNCVKFCLKNADMLGIDKNCVFFGGDSAGAHLSSLICAKQTTGHLKLDCKIRGTFLFYGVYDLKHLGAVNFNSCNALHNYFTKLYENRPDELLKFYNEYSPIEFITPAFPPSFITAGKIDHLTNTETETLVSLLNDLGVENTSLIFPKHRWDARHAFINLMFRARKQALAAAFTFLQTQISKYKSITTTPTPPQKTTHSPLTRRTKLKKDN